MKIKLSKPLVDLDGNTELGTTVGKAIASILGRSKSSDPMKSYVLGTTFYSKNEIDIDDADLKFVKDAIRADEQFFPVVKGQVLQYLEGIK